jgi:hypothetical protein
LPSLATVTADRMQSSRQSGVIKLLLPSRMSLFLDRLPSAHGARAYSLCGNGCRGHPCRRRPLRRWSMASETVTRPVSTATRLSNDPMRGVGGGADWEQREYPNWCGGFLVSQSRWGSAARGRSGVGADGRWLRSRRRSPGGVPDGWPSVAGPARSFGAARKGLHSGVVATRADPSHGCGQTVVPQSFCRRCLAIDSSGSPRAQQLWCNWSRRLSRGRRGCWFGMSCG